MTCNHSRYKTDSYMLAENAMKALGQRNTNNLIYWVGMVVTHCADCGENISHARRVRVKTVNEYVTEIE